MGVKLWLRNSERKKGQSHKLAKLWKGPFEILEVFGPVNYKIRLVNGKKKITIHRNRLKRCFMNIDLSETSVRLSQEIGLAGLEEIDGEDVNNRLVGNEIENVGFEIPCLEASPSVVRIGEMETLRPVFAPSVKNLVNMQDIHQLNPQESVRDDSVPSPLDRQDSLIRRGRPKKGEERIKKVRFIQPVRVQPERFVKRK